MVHILKGQSLPNSDGEFSAAPIVLFEKCNFGDIMLGMSLQRLSVVTRCCLPECVPQRVGNRDHAWHVFGMEPEVDKAMLNGTSLSFALLLGVRPPSESFRLAFMNDPALCVRCLLVVIASQHAVC